jgi:adenylate cyclase class 2
MQRLEIEIKAWCPDFAPVISLLEKTGAIFGETRKEDDTYFNHPSRNFWETDEALRIRKLEGASVLTYKGPRLPGASKARLECEAAVISDSGQLEKILLHLGFAESGSVHKIRSIYHIDGVEVSLDRVEGCGTFVELERIGAEKEAIEKELFALAERLDLRYFEKRSYLELVLEKAKPPF